jgi:hypothetical protein
MDSRGGRLDAEEKMPATNLGHLMQSTAHTA